MDSLRTVSGKPVKVNCTIALEAETYNHAVSQARARGVTLAKVLKEALAVGLVDRDQAEKKAVDR